MSDQTRDTTRPAVTQDHKFAVLAVADTRGQGLGTALVNLSGLFAASTSLPAEALSTWKANIGRLHHDELEATDLFLWAVTRSAYPQVLDAENQRLAKQVYNLFMGVLLAVPYFSSGRLTMITGANADGTPRARSLWTYPRTFSTLGAPTPRLTVGKLRLASRLAVALGKHDEFGGRERMERCLDAFRRGIEAARLDHRLHEFVRCAEGFAAAPFGNSAEHFADRLRRICSGRAKLHLREMYRIRSGIEHLHGPYARMPRRLSKKARFHRLLHRTVQAESLSRFLLAHYLMTDSLWATFVDHRSATAFWRKTPSQLASLWPPRLGLTHLLDDFDADAVAEHEAPSAF